MAKKLKVEDLTDQELEALIQQKRADDVQQIYNKTSLADAEAEKASRG